MNVFVSCGTKNKVDVAGEVKTSAPTDFYLHQEDMNVNHRFSYDAFAIEDACAKRYQVQAEIDKCIKEKEDLLEQLVKILSTEEKKNK